jgi:hypothetical protein
MTHAETLNDHLRRYYRPPGLRGLILTLWRSLQWLFRTRSARLLGADDE